jgi:hypothetical protein
MLIKTFVLTTIAIGTALADLMTCANNIDALKMNVASIKLPVGAGFKGAVYSDPVFNSVSGLAPKNTSSSTQLLSQV